ncbi:unnamed protein product, partial [Pylaiella littoralis]
GGPSPDARKAKKGLFRGRSFRKSRSKVPDDASELTASVSDLGEMQPSRVPGEERPLPSASAEGGSEDSVAAGLSADAGAAAATLDTTGAGSGLASGDDERSADLDEPLPPATGEPQPAVVAAAEEEEASELASLEKDGASSRASDRMSGAVDAVVRADGGSTAADAAGAAADAAGAAAVAPPQEVHKCATATATTTTTTAAASTVAAEEERAPETGEASVESTTAAVARGAPEPASDVAETAPAAAAAAAAENVKDAAAVGEEATTRAMGEEKDHDAVAKGGSGGASAASVDAAVPGSPEDATAPESAQDETTARVPPSVTAVEEVLREVAAGGAPPAAGEALKGAVAGQASESEAPGVGQGGGEEQPTTTEEEEEVDAVETAAVADKPVLVLEAAGEKSSLDGTAVSDAGEAAALTPEPPVAGSVGGEEPEEKTVGLPPLPPLAAEWEGSGTAPADDEATAAATVAAAEEIEEK